MPYWFKYPIAVMLFVGMTMPTSVWSMSDKDFIAKCLTPVFWFSDYRATDSNGVKKPFQFNPHGTPAENSECKSMHLRLTKEKKAWHQKGELMHPILSQEGRLVTKGSSSSAKTITAPKMTAKPVIQAPALRPKVPHRPYRATKPRHFRFKGPHFKSRYGGYKGRGSHPK